MSATSRESNGSDSEAESEEEFRTPYDSDEDPETDENGEDGEGGQKGGTDDDDQWSDLGAEDLGQFTDFDSPDVFGYAEL